LLTFRPSFALLPVYVDAVEGAFMMKYVKAQPISGLIQLVESFPLRPERSRYVVVGFALLDLKVNPPVCPSPGGRGDTTTFCDRILNAGKFALERPRQQVGLELRSGALSHSFELQEYRALISISTRM
jgi:hypothetical protein